MRVSIVNPAKKKAKKATKKTAKPWEKGLRAARKARKAKAKGKASTPAKPRKKKRKAAKKATKKRKKAPKAKKAKRAKTTKKRKTSKKSKVEHKPKKKRRKAKKVRMPTGKRIRPVMYRGKGRKLRHSPKSKYARKGYRFNPTMTKHMVKIGTFNNYMADVRHAPITHIAGMAGGFIFSGYAGGKVGKFVQEQTRNEIMGQIGSVAGNLIGTEVPAMIVHWGFPKVGLNKYAVPVARGMRVGGYIALGLNVFTLVLKVLKVPVPFRALGDNATMKEFVLSGLGDVDLLTAGVSGLNFDNTSSYASMDDESAGLVDEISALSEYIDGNSDDFAGVASEQASGSLTDL